jgi:excisionase family DNA binding protein
MVGAPWKSWKGDQMEAEKEKLKTFEHAAERLDLSHWTLRKWAQFGKIATHKIGGRRLVPESEIDRLIEQGKVPARAEAQRSLSDHFDHLM